MNLAPVYQQGPELCSVARPGLPCWRQDEEIQIDHFCGCVTLEGLGRHRNVGDCCGQIQMGVSNMAE